MTNYINEKDKQLEMQRTRVAEQKALIVVSVYWWSAIFLKHARRLL